MSRLYTVEFDAVAVSAAQDFFELTPADDKPVLIKAIRLFQYGTADYGDAQAEGLSIKFIRGFTTSGSGGSAPTPTPIDPNDAAAGFACEVNNTTVANTGTTTTVWADGFNVQAGYQENWPEDDMAPQASQANTSIVCRVTAPNDGLTMNGVLLVKEL